MAAWAASPWAMGRLPWSRLLTRPMNGPYSSRSTSTASAGVLKSWSAVVAIQRKSWP